MEVADLAMRKPFLIDGILACSIEHLAYLHPEQQQKYTIMACAH